MRIRARDRQDTNLALSPAEVEYIASCEHTELASNDLYLCYWVLDRVQLQPDFRINVTRTTFETDRVPEAWVPVLNQFDEVWVPCQFNLATFASSGVTVPLVKMPNFFQFDLYDVNGAKLQLPIAQSFTFLSVFDMQLRKGYDLLIEAFLNEFSSSEDAALVLKIRESHHVERLEALIEKHNKAKETKPPVYILSQLLSTTDMLGLYRACSAFVLPTRGEGWGRPFFEAMLMEMPVIGTNWSGQTEFMNEGNSYLVELNRLEYIHNSEFKLFDGHYWAEPSVEHLQAQMRRVYENPQEAKAKGRIARAELMEAYDGKLKDLVLRELGKFG